MKLLGVSWTTGDDEPYNASLRLKRAKNEKIVKMTSNCDLRIFRHFLEKFLIFFFFFPRLRRKSVDREERRKTHPLREQRVCANKKRTRQHSNGTNCSSWEIIPSMGFLCFLLLFLTRGRMNKSNNSFFPSKSQDFFFLIYLFQRFFLFYDN